MANMLVPEFFNSYMERLREGAFQLVVLGEVKKGKSSFINALLNYKELVPTSSGVATSTIFKIRYGSELSYKVHFLDEEGCRQELCIEAADIPKYGTEDGNPGNEKKVDFIEVTCPSPLLERGMVVIDTPGLGGIVREHQRITYKYVPEADAVFFVTDSAESPIGAAEIDFLKEIRSITHNVFFVQTKTGTVDEESALARQKNNLDIISSKLGDDFASPVYFMLDSALRHMADEKRDKELLDLSGFPELLDFVQRRLEPAKRRILAEKAVMLSIPFLQNLNDRLAAEKQLLDADTEEVIKQVQERLHATMKELSEWKNTKSAELQRNINTALDESVNHVISTLETCAPNGQIQKEMENMLHKISSQQELLEAVQEINDKLPVLAARCMQAAASKLRQEAAQVLKKHLHSVCAAGPKAAWGAPAANAMEMCEQGPSGQPGAASAAAPGVGYPGVSVGMDKEASEPNATFGASNIKESYGSVVGYAIAVLIGGAIVCTLPVVSVILVSSLGGVYVNFWNITARWRRKAIAQEQLNMQISSVCTSLSSVMESMHKSMLKQLDDNITSIKTVVRKNVDTVLEQKFAELQAIVAELKNRAGMDDEKLRARRNAYEQMKKQVESIQRCINEYLPEASGGFPKWKTA